MRRDDDLGRATWHRTRGETVRREGEFGVSARDGKDETSIKRRGKHEIRREEEESGRATGHRARGEEKEKVRRYGE